MNADAVAICVLASGSAGNCTAIALDGADHGGPGSARLVLIDLGLSPRATRRRLGDAGYAWRDVTDILLTHLDSDHFAPPWASALAHTEVRVHASAPHVQALRAAGVPAGRLHPIEPGFRGDPASCARLGARTTAHPTPLPHDDGTTLGWVLEHDGVRIGLATDLGHAPATLFEAFVDLDVLLIESNYDPAMQLASPRPAFLKARIMGGRGHLSNLDALEAALRIERAGRLQHVALLHLSRACNSPELVRRLWEERAPHLAARLVLCRQDVVTGALRVARRACCPVP